MERSCSKGTPTFVTLPQEPGLMPLQCAPKPPLSLCHVHVFSTSPLLLHMELASLTANATFFFFFGCFPQRRLSNVRRNLGGNEKKREKISMQMKTDV